MHRPTQPPIDAVRDHDRIHNALHIRRERLPRHIDLQSMRSLTTQQCQF
jgi:hypothetical protein